MDVCRLVEDCIKKFNLDIQTLRDVALAICISDKVSGTNQMELDVDKFVESDTELDWNNILTLLGITPQNRCRTKLPRVQKLRVISDVLSLSVCSEVSDLSLSCRASKKVAGYLGVSLASVDYMDENECYENLDKILSYIQSTNLDLSEFEKVYSNICIYSNSIISVGGFDLPEAINKLPVPDSIFNGVGKKYDTSSFIQYLESKSLTVDTYCKYFLDIYCFEVVQEVAKLLNNRLRKSEVEFNLILTRLNSFASSYLPIGTYSLEGYTHRLSVLRHVPSYLSRKVNMVFSESTAFSEMSILGCLSVLFMLRKTTISKDDLNKKLEVLVNECRE